MSILQIISSIPNLNKAWKALNKNNKDSKGLSGVSIKDFEANLKNNISVLSKSLRKGDFEFQLLRGVTIPKADNGKRPLRIPDIQDRLVHKALAIKLQRDLKNIYDLDNQFSFAYIKGRNIKMAITRMREYFDDGHKIILKVDIINFFDSIDSSKLVEEICSKLKDDSINQLLISAVKQTIGNQNEFKTEVYKQYFEDTGMGIPQGNSLSPLLSNIYLSALDKRIKLENLKMVRYADDLIIMCITKEKAIEAYEIVKYELSLLKLQMHTLAENDSKTQIIDPRQKKFVFLSVRFDGKQCTVSDEKIKAVKGHLRDLTTPYFLQQNFQEEIGLIQALIKIKNYLDGWLAAYFFLDIDKQVEELDKLVNVMLLRLFNAYSFDLQSGSLIKVAFAGKSNLVLSLNPDQRKNSGIPLYKKKLEKLRKGSLSSD